VFSVRPVLPWLVPAIVACAAPAAPEPEPVLPTDAALEEAGATIGEIVIDAKDIFDPGAQGENLTIFRWANAIHPNTKRRTIRNLLLFEKGSPYSRRLLDESARVLRQQSYLYDADVRPIHYENNTVDVLVVTHDVWTLKFGIGIGRSGGTNSTSFGLEDSNFAGFGKEVLFRHERSVDRTVYRYRYRDPAMGRTHLQLEAEYQHNSDGNVEAFAFGLPFYCFDCRWAVESSVRKGLKIQSLWDHGEVFAEFTQAGQGGDLSYGWSRGFRQGKALRYRVGYSYDEEIFSPVAGRPPTPFVPADRTLGFPWFELESVDDGYISTHDMDQIHRTEDVNLGHVARARFGWMAPAFGSDRTGLFTDNAAHVGFRRGADQVISLDGALSGRFTTKGAEDVLGSGTFRYFKRFRAWTAFSLLVQAQMARNLDGEQQILLGGDTGLRGYPLRFESGDRSFLVTLEQRFYGDREILHLFRLGGAVFFDMGAAWFHDTPEPMETRLLRDVGLGLRIGSTRSAEGSMLHMDVAFPLDGDRTIKRFQFLVSTHATF
jgi:hypothetical protein